MRGVLWISGGVAPVDWSLLEEKDSRFGFGAFGVNEWESFQEKGSGSDSDTRLRHHGEYDLGRKEFDVPLSFDLQWAWER